MDLTYFFSVIFQDGSTFHQNKEDVSATDPSKSAFYDVQSRLEDISVFALANAEGDVLAVDLSTGSFAANGIVFSAGDPRTQLPADTKYRLVFFRRHTHAFNAFNEEQAHQIEYHCGWQATVEGVNYQQTVSVR